MSVNVVPSLTTSVTQESEEKHDLTKGDGNTADKVEEASSSLEDDWENDPANPRNWSIGKKWVATAIVTAIAFYILLSSLFFFYRCHFTHLFLHWPVQ